MTTTNESTLNIFRPEKTYSTNEQQTDPVKSKNDDNIINNNNNNNSHTFRTYTRRWSMLALFIALSAANGYQWIHLTIIPNYVRGIYNASLPTEKRLYEPVIALIAMIYMILYIPLILPVVYLLERKGLRITIILGALVNALGAWLKAFSLLGHPPMFWLMMIGQSFASSGQAFTLGMPPILAATWFGPEEVSTATSLGVFGNQIGIALGLGLPPVIVDSERAFDFDDAMLRFNWMSYVAAVSFTLLAILIVVFFKNEPDVAPSPARMLAKSNPIDFCATLRSLFTNANYVSLLFSYGINTGTFYCISTLLEEMLDPYFPGRGKLIGFAGFAMTLAGVAGSVIMGLVMDKTKRYRLLCNIVYCLIFASFAAHMGLLLLHSMALLYIMMLILGFFLTGYLSLGFEYAAEITFPENEGISSSFLNSFAMFFGIVFTYSFTYIIQSKPVLYGHFMLCAMLLLGTILTVTMRPVLRRQQMQQSSELREPEAVPAPMNEL